VKFSAAPYLLLGTTNRHRIAEFQLAFAAFGMEVRTPEQLSLTLPEVLEDGLTIAENSAKKAICYARASGVWVVADDTALEVDCLDGRPGVHSARFAGPNATMAENRALLMTELRGIPHSQRTARFVCHLTVADPQARIVASAVGSCPGIIVDTPQGTGGFGYDTLFLMPEFQKTMAELDDQQRCAATHRGLAVRQLLSATSQ